MGSVVGGLYAVGYTAAALDTIATTADWTALLTDPVNRRDLPVDRKVTEDRYLLTLPIHRGGIQLPRGVVAGQRISQLLTELTWSVHPVGDFRHLPRPFAAVATDVETGKATVLDRGFLPDAIRASMALPSVFSPVEIDDHVLIDGGVVRNLPAQDARALGADFLICSDVTDPLDPHDSLVTFVDVLTQAVSFREWDSESEQRSKCDVVITPQVHRFGAFAFGAARDVIAQGEAAARAALPQIEAALATRARTGTPRGPLVEPESVFVASVRFERPEGLPAGWLDQTLRLGWPRWVRRQELDDGIDRLYATGRFELVRYHLDPLPGGPGERRQLTVFLRERMSGRFGLGLRYDSRYKASVLLAGTFPGMAGFGSQLEVDARLGQQIEVGLGLSRSVGDGSALMLGADARYARAPFDLYVGGHEVAQARTDLGSIGGSIAHHFGAAAKLAVRAKVEYARWADQVSAVDSAPIERTFYTAAGSFALDTYDRDQFPTRGLGLVALSEWGNRLLGTGGSFSHQFADVRAYLPLYRTISLWSGATVGATGGTPPPHYRFFLGGANTYYLFPDRDLSFVGLRTEELGGRHLQKVEAGIQWEFVHDVFGQVRWNAGNVYERWTWKPAGYLDGVGFDLGTKTFAGRLDLSVWGSPHAGWPHVEVDLGYPF